MFKSLSLTKILKFAEQESYPGGKMIFWRTQCNAYKPADTLAADLSAPKPPP